MTSDKYKTLFLGSFQRNTQLFLVNTFITIILAWAFSLDHFKIGLLEKIVCSFGSSLFLLIHFPYLPYESKLYYIREMREVNIPYLSKIVTENFIIEKIQAHEEVKSRRRKAMGWIIDWNNWGLENEVRKWQVRLRCSFAFEQQRVESHGT